MAETTDDEKRELELLPKVLIMGGTGFIARHLVVHLLDNNLAGQIICADKTMVIMAHMTKKMQEAYKDPRVTFLHSDLSQNAHLKNKIFKDGASYDYIINLAGETRFGKGEADYERHILEVVKRTAKHAGASKLTKWVEVSTGQVYEASKKPVGEKAKLSPWTNLAKYRLQAEVALQNAQIPHTILRPAIVYGPGDKTGLTPRLTIACGYKLEGAKMEFLWTKGVRMNTVHVRDLAAAIWLAATKGRAGAIYNVSDPSDFTQGDMNTLLEKLFEIKVGFKGKMINTAAKTSMKTVAAMVNNKHIPQWEKVKVKYNILDTPLTPYLDEEILSKNHFGVNGALICKELGFKYSHPKPTVELLQEVCAEFMEQKYFPKMI